MRKLDKTETLVTIGDMTFIYLFIYVFCDYYYSAKSTLLSLLRFYSDSPTLLPIMMPRHPAHSAL